MVGGTQGTATRWPAGSNNRCVRAGLPAEFMLRTGMPTRPGLLQVLAWATSLLTSAPQLLWPAYAPALGETLAGQLTWLQAQQPAAAPTLSEALTDWREAAARYPAREVHWAWPAGTTRCCTLTGRLPSE